MGSQGIHSSLSALLVLLDHWQITETVQGKLMLTSFWVEGIIFSSI